MPSAKKSQGARFRITKTAKDVHLPAPRYPDLGPLATYTSLRNVTFGNRSARIGDLAPLAALPRLERLALPTLATVGSLAALAKLTALKTLVIGKGYEELAIHPPPALRELELPYHRVKDLHFLAKGFSSLRSLSAGTSYPSRTVLANLDGIEGAVALEEIMLLYTRVSDLGPLAKLPRLRSIWLTDHRQLTDLEPLADCHALERLTLYGGAVKTLAPLAKLRRLRQVHLGPRTARAAIDASDLPKRVRVIREA